MKRHILILSLLTILGTGCMSARWQQTELYFGMERKTGEITPAEWNGFVTDHIAKVFPDGFTVVQADGMWLNRETRQPVREPSRIVITIHKKDKALSARIDSLRATYNRLFQQQAVLRVDQKVKVSF